MEQIRVEEQRRHAERYPLARQLWFSTFVVVLLGWRSSASKGLLKRKLGDKRRSRSVRRSATVSASIAAPTVETHTVYEEVPATSASPTPAPTASPTPALVPVESDYSVTFYSSFTILAVQFWLYQYL